MAAGVFNLDVMYVYVYAKVFMDDGHENGKMERR